MQLLLSLMFFLHCLEKEIILVSAIVISLKSLFKFRIELPVVNHMEQNII
jgi:hypothetical protein